MTHGLIRFEKGLYCFNPETGAELTDIPADPKSTRQIFFHADGVFHLSTGVSATLTVYEPGTWKRLWSVKDLAGVSEMVGPYVHRRLLCKSDDALFVIDTKQQKLLAKISPPQFKGEGSWYWQTEKKVLVLSQGMQGVKDKLSCFALPADKLLWSRDAGFDREEGLAIRGEVVLTAEPEKAPPNVRGVAPPVVAVSLEEGKEIWRWQVPQLEKQFADYVYLRLEACPSGFIVTRTWIVLD